MDVEVKPNSLATGNLDGNGFMDLVVTGPDGIPILLGRGDGSFRGIARYTVGQTAEFVGMEHFNRDGRPDWAANQLPNSVSLAYNVLLPRFRTVNLGAVEDALIPRLAPTELLTTVCQVTSSCDGVPTLLVQNAGGLGTVQIALFAVDPLESPSTTRIATGEIQDGRPCLDDPVRRRLPRRSEGSGSGRWSG